jgi:DNA-binding MarR family transcriptional regulator
MSASPNLLGAPLTDEELAAWHGMLRLQAHVLRAVDGALGAVHRLSVSEFDVLITLTNAPDGRLRITDLAQQVMLSRSGLSRLVDRLQQDGLVIRTPDPDDARGARAAITDAGQVKLDEARTTHNAVIREQFLHRLSPEEQRRLGDIWQKFE